MEVRCGKAFRAILAVVRRALALLVLTTCVASGACGGDEGLSYSGEVGVPVAARFDSLIPEVAMRIDGSAPLRFFCDTGSPITFFDTTALAGARDGKHRSDLEVFGLSFPDFPTVSWDAFADDGIAAGLIGGDLLGHFAFGIDHQGERVWLGEPGRPVPRPGDVRAAADTALPFELAGGGISLLPGDCGASGCGSVRFAPTRIMVKLRFETLSFDVWAVLDTGATAVTVEDALFDSLSFEDPSRPLLDGAVISTVSGPRAAFFSRTWRVEARGADGSGAVALEDVPITVVPDLDLFPNLSAEVGVDVRVFLGGSFLRHFLTTIDYPEGVVRLGRYDDPTHVPPDEFIGVGMTLVQDGASWIASEVYPGHDAYADGVRPGDVVEAIDGMPITGQPGEVVNGALAAFALGEEVPMTVRRLATERELLILVEDLLPSYPPPT
jgi:hypothetical protein